MKRRVVGSVMTGDVVPARDSTPRAALERRPAEYDISGLPVVDADDKVIGVVSATNLRRAGERPGRAGPLTTGELMSAPAITLRADDPAVRAARVLTERGIEQLPVVDEEARLAQPAERRRRGPRRCGDAQRDLGARRGRGRRGADDAPDRRRAQGRQPARTPPPSGAPARRPRPWPRP